MGKSCAQIIGIFCVITNASSYCTIQSYETRNTTIDHFLLIELVFKGELHTVLHVLKQSKGNWFMFMFCKQCQLSSLYSLVKIFMFLLCVCLFESYSVVNVLKP